jgi:hypothetical protein
MDTLHYFAMLSIASNRTARRQHLPLASDILCFAKQSLSRALAAIMSAHYNAEHFARSHPNA